MGLEELDNVRDGAVGEGPGASYLGCYAFDVFSAGVEVGDWEVWNRDRGYVLAGNPCREVVCDVGYSTGPSTVSDRRSAGGAKESVVGLGDRQGEEGDGYVQDSAE